MPPNAPLLMMTTWVQRSVPPSSATIRVVNWPTSLSTVAGHQARPGDFGDVPLDVVAPEPDGLVGGGAAIRQFLAQCA